MNCDIIDCPEKAKYNVGLVLRANSEHAPAKTSPMVHVCENHKEVKWRDLVDERGWQKICNNFLAHGLAIPLEQFSNVYIEEIKSNE